MRVDLAGHHLAAVQADVHLERAVVVRLRVAEVHAQAVALLAIHKAAVPLEARLAQREVRVDHLAEVFGVQPRGQRGRAGHGVAHRPGAGIEGLPR